MGYVLNYSFDAYASYTQAIVMNTKIYTFFLSILMASSLWGQNLSDAVRWSVFQPASTGRTLGVAGSFGAMGGDFSVLSVNPAGLGEYARGEFVFTPSMNFKESNAFLVKDPSRSSKEDDSSIKIDNLGFVASTSPMASNWTHSNFAIGYNKVSDLGRTFYFEGKTVGSITEEFTEYANGKNLDELDNFRAWPAYSVGAIYDLDEDEDYESDFQERPLQPVQKRQLVSQEGSINELAFAWGGKYDNRLNVGVVLGVPFVNYEETKTYEELDPDREISLFDDLTFTEYLNTTGVGLNIKAGLIYTINKTFRLGGAIHSPTWYTLNDDYYTHIEYAYTDTENNRFEHRSPDGSFKYKINSPWRAIGSLGAILKLGNDVVGFINGDVEWVDYGESSVDLTAYSSDPIESQKTISINRDISQFLGKSINIRLGTELGIQKLRLRAGYESTQSPYNADLDRMEGLSFGVGLREDNFFMDLGFQTRQTTEGYLPYVVIDQDRHPLVNVETVRKKFLFTVGFKF